MLPNQKEYSDPQSVVRIAISMPHTSYPISLLTNQRGALYELLKEPHSQILQEAVLNPTLCAFAT